MQFTDDEMKRVKGELYEISNNLRPWITPDQLKALITRLEAAEKYIEETRRDCEACGEPIGETDASMEAEEAWAKASGRL